MSVRLRKDRSTPDSPYWQYEFEHKGKCHRRRCLNEDGSPCMNRREAEAAERRARVLAEQEPKLPAAADYTLGQALAALLPKWEKQDNWHNRKRYVAEMLEFFPAETPVRDITQARVQDYINFASAQHKHAWAGGGNRDPNAPENKRYWIESTTPRSPGTVNLHLQVIRQALRHATTVRD